MSTTCGTGASRICTNGASSAKCSAKCRPTRPCGCTSTRSAGRIPRGSRVCPRRAWCSSRTSPSPALVTVLWPRKASFAVGPYEWCSTVARAIAIDIRSCRHHERSRRSRRRLAAPVQATSAMLPARVLENTRDKCALQSTLVFNCFGPRRLVVCVVCVVCGVWCVWCVVCGLCDTLKKPVCPLNTSPCVRSERLRVYRHHAQTCLNMCAWCRHTRGRIECIHGGG